MCVLLLWRHARLSALHPATIYVLFHVLVFTSRAYFVLTDSPTLFTGWGGGVVPIRDTEISWAMNLADLALVSMTVAWIKVAGDDRRRKPVLPSSADRSPEGAMLSGKVIRNVSVVAFPVGVLAIVYFAYLPGASGYGAPHIDLGNWNNSTWTMITQSWPGLVLLSLIYYYGFRRRLVALLSGYLLVMAIQGGDRFRVVIPLIYLVLIWLLRHRQKWPPLWMALAGSAVLFIVFPLKGIGFMVQNGEPISDIVEVLVNSTTDVTSGRAPDQLILDEFACTVSLVDESHHYYYGALYYPLLTLPVPRQLWSDKPAVNMYQYELSNPSRPMVSSGMVSTLHGESYANGGLFGVIIISFISAYWLGRFYFRAMRAGYFSVCCFAYLIVACNLIQIYRDGLVSLVMFTVVNMMPLVAIALLSYISHRRKRTWSSIQRRVAFGSARGTTAGMS